MVDDIDRQDIDGNTALHRAVLAGDVQEMMDLLHASIDVGTKNNDGLSALELAEKRVLDSEKDDAKFLDKKEKIQSEFTNIQQASDGEAAVQSMGIICDLIGVNYDELVQGVNDKHNGGAKLGDVITELVGVASSKMRGELSEAQNMKVIYDVLKEQEQFKSWDSAVTEAAEKFQDSIDVGASAVQGDVKKSRVDEGNKSVSGVAEIAREEPSALSRSMTPVKQNVPMDKLNEKPLSR